MSWFAQIEGHAPKSEFVDLKQYMSQKGIFAKHREIQVDHSLLLSCFVFIFYFPQKKIH